MIKPFGIFITLLIYISFVSCEKINVFTTEDDIIKEIPSYELVNDNARAYLVEIDYSNDSQYLNSFVVNYRSDPVSDMTRPLPVSLKWENTDFFDSLKLYISCDVNFTEAWVYNLKSKTESYEVYNLIPNRDYYWKVLGLNNRIEEIVVHGQFSTKGLRRLIYIPGDYIGNVRDLGGLTCDNKKHIKYGKLYRGGEILRDDGGPYMRISDEGIYELKNRIGCSVELDFGDLWEESPLENKGFEVFKDHNLYGFYGYDRADRGLRTEIGRKCLHNCLELIIQKLLENKSVYFHCNSGADRTGTFAFIIEALCGVSDNDKSKDYELTSLWAFYYKDPHNKYTYNPSRFRNSPAEGKFGYKSMITYINETFDGSNINEKVFNMCTSSFEDEGLGLTKSQINTLISCLAE